MLVFFFTFQNVATRRNLIAYILFLLDSTAIGHESFISYFPLIDS